MSLRLRLALTAALLTLGGLALVAGILFLVDGGVLNNTPTDVMQQFCSAIIVSDVTQGQAVEVDFEAFPSPWQLLWRRLSPFHEEVRTPRLMSILTRTAVLSSIMRDSLARDVADLYLRMPVQEFGMLQMGRIEEIVEAGYAHSREVLDSGRDAPWHARIMAEPEAPAPKPGE